MERQNYSTLLSIQLFTILFLIFSIGIPSNAYSYNWDCNNQITVTNGADDGPGSLRQALRDICPGGYINFSNTIQGDSIFLSSGELIIDKDVTIDGPGADHLRISAGYLSRVFQILEGVEVRIEDLEIAHGLCSISPIGFNNGQDRGAAIWNKGKLTFEDCEVFENQTIEAIGGAGIYSEGENARAYIIRATFRHNANNHVVTNPFGYVDPPGPGSAVYTEGGKTYVWDSYFDDNTGSAVFNASYTLLERCDVVNNLAIEGAGIMNAETGRMEIRYTTIADNTGGWACFQCGGSSAGISNAGQMDLENSLVNGNAAGNYWGSGGGIGNSGVLNIVNSTISNNYASGRAPIGGGINNSGTLNINFSTIVDNAAIGSGYGGGIASSGDVSMKNTILANNYADGAYYDFRGELNSQGYNLIGRTEGIANFTPQTGDLFGSNNNPLDPQLAELFDNGGHTQTYALSENSPAVNSADPSTSINIDQRGFERPLGGQADIGAFESTFEPAEPSLAVESFTLVDTDTDTDIHTLTNGTTVNLAEVGHNISIRANTTPSSVGSVRFKLNGNSVRLENVAPYAIAGDNSGDYFAWNVPMGTHTLSAIPYSESNGQGTEGDELSITITFVNEANRKAQPSTDLADISIYPNPSQGQVQIQSAFSGEVYVKVMNLSGQILERKEIILNGNASLDLSHLANGVYFVEFQQNDARVLRKVVKQ